MKYLIFSDSHGSVRQMERVLRGMARHLTGVIHLGDGIEEFRALSRLPGMERLLFLDVCGNGEQFSMPSELRPPLVRVLTAGKVRILLTHGHAQGVAYGTEALAALAMENGCALALHGHTHIAMHTIAHLPGGDVEILCPGSIACPRQGGPSYGVVDVTEQGQILAFFEEV